ncbi:hypothetical protein GUITHDRAFT_114153 [Guillardia theta CCMP2712]|uniref:Uncharacterized protein n=1 Tax=Guillardia theta (strain CCMP2712) TaxID=905079 RepID=L1ITR5_GUITC|nr:hypothetical protein GUITHDRAFT_114153 [Guillardia theta CCMP2712]EKX39656.1 hypothetical protein GUITHDRAFT_114153 [Guillardia theta CCMP2712]|eukprot:XP_005826636.1 hypothetical protein GUITHDRAFT_114153 [Guillardia theta CCMP2712]
MLLKAGSRRVLLLFPDSPCQEREEADLEQRQLRDLDPSVQEARHAAERRMKDLEQGTTKLEAVLSKLRQRKMALMKEINVVRSQKEEMAHACQRLAQENQGLQLTLQNVAAKIEVVHADRLASDSHKQLLQEESRAIEDEIESLSRKLHQARTLALSSVNAAGKKMAVELV